MSDEKSQADEFKELAREISADPQAWDELLKKLAAQKPTPEKPE